MEDTYPFYSAILIILYITLYSKDDNNCFPAKDKETENRYHIYLIEFELSCSCSNSIMLRLEKVPV